VQKEPQLFQRREVQLGTEQERRVQVRDGVRPGEFVIGRGAIFVDNEWQQ
jgi:cobalt-zinc-cadmium efflux system membrane fusion protein